MVYYVKFEDYQALATVSFIKEQQQSEATEIIIEIIICHVSTKAPCWPTDDHVVIDSRFGVVHLTNSQYIISANL